MTSRALVLGGGGVTGVAWELGLLAGLAEAGVDLTDADVVIGTSAGSVVAAQVTSGVDLEKLYEAQLVGPGSELAARLSTATALRWGLAALSSRDPQRVRARIGAMALAARTVPEAERRAVIEARLPVHDWPGRRLLVTAVDAASGEFVAFDRDSGVRLVDAVGASCAVPGVWPPVTIDGRRYVDGGVRSAANVDLAQGYERVVVIAPLVRGGGVIPSVAKQVATLSGAAVVVSPDEPARKAIGRNALDPARRAPAARAGRAQAAAVSAAVAEVWSR
ncbi:patatin-like phospholipase family protein [Planosporangium mesophilum]|uniref:Patatin n=1 Tax=Planosporangium mesophilum TaxID=689768 RepID=A0A8J3TKD0_9ACTN|nr:patatin-like phospholipase family protein [Planosporangium mesophilum]NJC86171.1 patatin-like phospholipase family protein [Planosporangium mesophilum]GII22980.1 patatin [Planosporangium mesophilum]